jgi:excisionase family DNA binding protein
MIDVDDWAEIRRLRFSKNLGIEIARRLEVSKNTVRRAVRSNALPHYERPRRHSLVDAVEPRICELL